VFQFLIGTIKTGCWNAF